MSAANASARLSMTLRHALTIAAYGPRQTARASGRPQRIGTPLDGEQQGNLKIIRKRKWCELHRDKIHALLTELCLQ